MSKGHVVEVAAADLVGTSPRETGMLMNEAAVPSGGGILLISNAHAWDALPDHGQHVLRQLYQKLTEYRDEMSEDLVVILAGQPGPIADLLRTSPALAARFRAVIHFPGYTPRQLAALADEAGFTLTPNAAHKAAAALAQAESNRSTGSARLAIRLLDEAADAQARRIASAPHSHDPIAVATISATDIPERLDAHHALSDDPWPGQYL